MQRGELYWARFPAPVGRRPVLIVSRDATLSVRSHVTVAPVTRTMRGIRSEVALGRAHGLRAACVANCDNLQTIPKTAIGPRRLGKLPAMELASLDRALRFALGIRS